MTPLVAFGYAICQLVEPSRLRRATAELIYNEFWANVPGVTIESLEARLAQAADADQIPLALVAITGEEVIGAVNLIEYDDENHPEWSPWVAGLVVAKAHRGKTVGTALVEALLGHARRLGISRVYLGSDSPEFYTRLGAEAFQEARPGFWFLRFELADINLINPSAKPEKP